MTASSSPSPCDEGRGDEGGESFADCSPAGQEPRLLCKCLYKTAPRLLATEITKNVSTRSIKDTKIASALPATGAQAVVRCSEVPAAKAEATSALPRTSKLAGTENAATKEHRAAQVPECLHHPYQSEPQIVNVASKAPTTAKV